VLWWWFIVVIVIVVVGLAARHVGARAHVTVTVLGLPRATPKPRGRPSVGPHEIRQLLADETSPAIAGRYRCVQARAIGGAVVGDVEISTPVPLS
jgi:hypothetical protein